MAVVAEIEKTPPGFRKAFPAHWALERVHTLAADRVTHLRIAGYYSTGYGAGGGDGPLCDGELESPGTFNEYGGAQAIAKTNCPHCKKIGKQMLEDAAEEREAVEAETRGMEATLSVLHAMNNAREGAPR